MRQVAVLTDLHYGWPDDEDPGAYMGDELARTVDRIRDLDVDAVVLLGDIVHDAGTESGTRQRIHAVRDRFQELSEPVYAVPGNQDVLSMTAARMIEELDVRNDDPYFSVDLEDSRLIGLDTTQRRTDLHGIGGLVGARQREWLDGVLDARKDVFVLSHHMLYARSLADTELFSDIPELGIAADKEYVLDICDRHDVSGFINGHIHEEDHRSVRGTPHLTMRAYNHVTTEPGVSGNLGLLEMRDHGFALETDFQSYGHTY